MIGARTFSTTTSSSDLDDLDSTEHQVRERQRVADRIGNTVVDRTETRKLLMLQSSYMPWRRNVRRRRGTLTPQYRQRPYSMLLRNSSMKMPAAKDHVGASCGVTFSDKDLPYDQVLNASRGTSLMRFSAVGNAQDIIGMSKVVQLPIIHSDTGVQEIEVPLFAKVITSSQQRQEEEERLVGFCKFRCRLIVKPKSIHAINWSPFPSRHATLRENPDFEPTRLATIKIRELFVEGVSLAFDIAGGEFNVNRLTRKIADGKVLRALPRHFQHMAPNTLAIRVISVSDIPGHDRLLRVKVTIRDVVVKTCAQLSQKGHCIWNHAMEIPCPDASAVIHVQLLETGHTGSTMIGQWMTTAKMMVLDRLNVFGRDLLTSQADGDIDTKRFPGIHVPSYSLSGKMALRDKKWLPWLKTTKHQSDTMLESSLSPRSARRVREAASRAVPVAQLPEIDLELCYFHDPTPNGLTQDQVLAYRPLTALEQLQMNSAETEKKLGNIAQVEKMLEDFPLLFDVRALEVSHINIYLRPLFSGYRGLGDLEVQHEDDSDSEEDQNDASKLLARISGSRRQRGAIYMTKLDLRDALLARGDNEAAGVDVARLARTLVVSLVRPVLSEVSIYSAGKHILGGLFQGYFSKATSNSPKKGKEQSIVHFVRKRHRESVDRLFFALDNHKGGYAQRKYLSWLDQLDLLTEPSIQGRLIRARVSTQLLLRLRKISSALHKHHKSTLVWCEIHGKTLYYTKLGKNGASRVGFTKLVHLDNDHTYISQGANDELILRYRRGKGAFRNVVLTSYSRNEPSAKDWHKAIENARSPGRLSSLELAELEHVPIATDNTLEKITARFSFLGDCTGQMCPNFARSTKDSNLDESQLTTDSSLDDTIHYPRHLSDEDHAAPSSRVLLAPHVNSAQNSRILPLHDPQNEEEVDEEEDEDTDDEVGDD
eukprot:CAMPEP_0197325098 /NCGR_PEP_ID=MMETSP0891-20130614/71484_1 /TAXON_ID=44058 ORGANISM="Aureoumbra lagunensis, Strain CCMP1510" /NCGR_SAMPLE_ID=MMETSP0891 /ASSEMBLY_ACC=CAM_ASM_000534 /LENGTH=935 /DNA_ID=CAMNT_0042818011 /DNA_START=1477 /DNA_END=4284 /DNA_ORIENTATION=-